MYAHDNTLQSPAGLSLTLITVNNLQTKNVHTPSHSLLLDDFSDALSLYHPVIHLPSILNYFCGRIGGKVLRENGAHDVIAVATHAVLSGPAVERLSTGVFSEVIVSNSILLPPEKKFPQLTVLSIAPLIGETIWRLNEQSFS